MDHTPDWVVKLRAAEERKRPEKLFTLFGLGRELGVHPLEIVRLSNDGIVKPFARTNSGVLFRLGRLPQLRAVKECKKWNYSQQDGSETTQQLRKAINLQQAVSPTNKIYHHARRQTLEWKLINRAASHRRHVLKLGARPSWVTDEMYKSFCAERDRRNVREGLHYSDKRAWRIDHFYPLQPVNGHRPGQDEPGNWHLIRHLENERKGNKQPQDFYSSAKFKQIKRQLGKQSAKFRSDTER